MQHSSHQHSKMDYIKVKDRDHLVRDEYSNGILNTDVEGYNKYIATYKTKYKEAQKIKKMEDEISSIKDDLSDIKMLLRRIVDDEAA